MPYDLPPGTEEIWDIAAKAMLMREGFAVAISRAELEQAAQTPCEIELQNDGSIVFRLEGVRAN